MKYLVFVICFLVVSCPALAGAVTGISLGGKMGYAQYTGDVLPSSGDVGGGLLYGAIIEVTTLPVVDFEIHANYFTKNFDYRYDVGGISVGGEFEFRDFSMLVLAKKNLVPVPGSPLGLYIGGGLGWHLLNTDVAQAIAADPSLADQPLQLFSNTAKMSGHGLLGVKVSPPMIPLAIFGEARYGRIFTDEPINMTQIEAGLLLTF